MSQYDLSAPAIDLAEVTPDDDASIALTRGLYVGGAGDLAVVTHGGTSVTLVGVLAGVVYPLRVTKVLATGTTATNVLAIY